MIICMETEENNMPNYYYKTKKINNEKFNFCL